MNKWLRIAMTVWALAWPTLAGASECAAVPVARWVPGDCVAGAEKTLFHESWTEVGSQTFDPGASVLAAEDARFAAMTGANSVELGAWLADDLEYVHSTGKVENREQFLASIAGGTLRYLEIGPMERQVVMLGHDSALVRGHGRMLAMAGDTRLDMEIRYLAIYGLGGDGRWRLRSWQSLRMPQTSG